MQNKDEALGTQPIGKLMLSLALPAVAAQFINMLYNIVDRIYIGNIPGTGALALTGVGVTFPIILLVSAFAGRKRVLDAYAEAIANNYRFFSYGDAMLIR